MTHATSAPQLAAQVVHTATRVCLAVCFAISVVESHTHQGGVVTVSRSCLKTGTSKHLEISGEGLGGERGSSEEPLTQPHHGESGGRDLFPGSLTEMVKAL